MLIKKIAPWFVFVGLILLIIWGLASKDKMNQHLSRALVNSTPQGELMRGAAIIDSVYNYTKNGQDYQITFLEFGATNCIACKKMEAVMQEVKEQYPNRVNVVFLNVLEAENQRLMKYYGIATIPTQVLLNRYGKETYRHTGFISTLELSEHFALK